MRNSDFPRTKVYNGYDVPLAFVYDSMAYYFDVDCFDDSKSTIALSADGKETTGKSANEMLVEAVHAYGRERKKVWMAKWFKDCVAYELEQDQEN